MKNWMDGNMSDIIIALNKVIKNWGIFEVVCMLILLPYSAIYLLIRVIQEME